jgi:hypothetical protein
VNIDGTALAVRNWGSNDPYQQVNPFTPSGGGGSET